MTDAQGADAMDKSKIENLNPQEYTHLPHADQNFQGHEQTDVAIRPLAITLAVIGLMVAISMIGMWGLFKVFERTAGNLPENQPAAAVKVDPRSEPEGYPLLQGIPKTESPHFAAEEMRQLKATNAEILAGRKPMRDGIEPGMPIDQAIDEALSQKIFKTAGAAAASSTQQSKGK